MQFQVHLKNFTQENYTKLFHVERVYYKMQICFRDFPILIVALFSVSIIKFFKSISEMSSICKSSSEFMNARLSIHWVLLPINSGIYKYLSLHYKCNIVLFLDNFNYRLGNSQLNLVNAKRRRHSILDSNFNKATSNLHDNVFCVRYAKWSLFPPQDMFHLQFQVGDFHYCIFA